MISSAFLGHAPWSLVYFPQDAIPLFHLFCSNNAFFTSRALKFKCPAKSLNVDCWLVTSCHRYFRDGMASLVSPRWSVFTVAKVFDPMTRAWVSSGMVHSPEQLMLWSDTTDGWQQRKYGVFFKGIHDVCVVLQSTSEEIWQNIK
jgi:hypothetical protein